MKYNKIYLFCIAIMSLFASCEEEASFDMSYPKPIINSVSSFKAELGTDITIKGDFQEVSTIYFGSVKAEDFTVAEGAKSLTVTVPRKTDPEGVNIAISNNYSMTTLTEELFVPTVPSTTISEVGEIQSELSFRVEGTNVDLITSLKVNGEEVSILSAKPEKVVASVAGMGLKPGGLATVEFTTLALDVIPPAENVNIVYPFVIYNEISLFDFEDDTHAYVGEGEPSIREGDVNGKTEKYFELRAPGYEWAKETGRMAYEEVPDFSTIVNPYVTFCVRTPAGSAGYFQLEDGTGMWRHFGWGFRTDGEWMIISQPLEANWEGGGTFNPATFKPTLSFKAGNAKTQQDVDLAYFRITEGLYDGSQQDGDELGGSDKPAIISLLNFDDPSENPDIKNGETVIMSLNLRNDVSPFNGTGALGVIGDGTRGNWAGYWGSSIPIDLSSTDLSIFDDPHLSFAVNTSDLKQYIVFKIYQYDKQMSMAAKYFPLTTGKWNTFQFSLFNTELENWTPVEEGNKLQEHYKSLKYLNPDVPIDKIEVIVCRHGGNAIEFSLDEVAITEGPRF